MQSKLRAPRFRSAKIIPSSGKSGTDITDRDVQADIQRMLRDIIITHVPMEKMNFQDRVLFLGQMIRYLVLLADGQIPVSLVLLIIISCRCGFIREAVKIHSFLNALECLFINIPVNHINDRLYHLLISNFSPMTEISMVTSESILRDP